MLSQTHFTTQNQIQILFKFSQTVVNFTVFPVRKSKLLWRQFSWSFRNQGHFFRFLKLLFCNLTFLHKFFCFIFSEFFRILGFSFLWAPRFLIKTRFLNLRLVIYCVRKNRLSFLCCSALSIIVHSIVSLDVVEIFVKAWTKSRTLLWLQRSLDGFPKFRIMSVFFRDIALLTALVWATHTHRNGILSLQIRNSRGSVGSFCI